MKKREEKRQNMSISTLPNWQPLQLAPEFRHMVVFPEAKNEADAQILQTLEFVKKFLSRIKETDISII